MDLIRNATPLSLSEADPTLKSKGSTAQKGSHEVNPVLSQEIEADPTLKSKGFTAQKRSHEVSPVLSQEITPPPASMQDKALPTRTTAVTAMDQNPSSETLEEVVPPSPQSSLAETTDAVDLSLRTEAVTAMDKNPSSETLQEFIDAFAALEICKDSEQATPLKALSVRLYEKSPKMLAGILDNCQWLKGKAQDSFIYSATVAGMETELADTCTGDVFSGSLMGFSSLYSDGRNGRNG